MFGSISSVKTKPVKEWFKNDTPPEAINLIVKML